MKHHDQDLDAADMRLLRAVQGNAGRSQADLAELAGVSPSQVSRRLARLRELGVLRAVVGLVDPPRVGLTCSALCRVKLRNHSEEDLRLFRDLVDRMPEVVYCAAITGVDDYILRLIARDLPHFQELIQAHLLRCPAIAHVESGVVLDVVKDTTELPLGG